jgi:hydroxypyruvate reductase
MAREAAPGQPLLLLVSGGASSLLEVPADGISLDDLRRVSGWALASGEPIERVNAVRRRLSQVKDGRLLARLGLCRTEGYYISDVPGDDPALVGSGLLARAPGGFEARALPAWLQEMLGRARTQPAGHSDAPLECVGRIDDALGAIERAARAAGARVMRPAGRLEGDALEAASQACARLCAGPAGLLLLGGETTVALPSRTGRGGRNQHLALAAALRIAGRHDLLLLAAGTDGSDGNSADAGALVDGETVARGRDAGLDPAQCLERADSGRFLEESGDLLHTGPTGTNVGDLVLALRRDPDHSQPPGPSM